MADLRPSRRRRQRRPRGKKGPAPREVLGLVLVDVNEALCNSSVCFPALEGRLSLNGVTGDCLRSSSDSHQMLLTEASFRPKHWTRLIGYDSDLTRKNLKKINVSYIRATIRCVRSHETDIYIHVYPVQPVSVLMPQKRDEPCVVTNCQTETHTAVNTRAVLGKIPAVFYEKWGQCVHVLFCFRGGRCCILFRGAWRDSFHSSQTSSDCWSHLRVLLWNRLGCLLLTFGIWTCIKMACQLCAGDVHDVQLKHDNTGIWSYVRLSAHSRR